jgi:hypothetical protein
MYEFDGDSNRPVSGSESFDLDTALRSGLRSIPTPTIAPDFDSKVLARLAEETAPWYVRTSLVVRSLKPAFAAGALSLPICLTLIAWLSKPIPTTITLPSSNAVSARMAPLDQALDRPDLSPATLRRISDDDRATRGRRGETQKDIRSTATV